MTKYDVNKAIRKVHPKLRVHQGPGCCTFYSIDNEFGLKLSRIYSPTVYINHWSQLTIDQWTDRASDIITQLNERGRK